MMNKLNNYSDEELLQLMQSGDISAFEELYDRYWMPLYNEAASKVTCPDTTAQILEDVFIALWQNRRGIKISVYTYCYSSLKADVFQYLQKEYNLLNSAESNDAFKEVGRFPTFESNGISSESIISRLLHSDFLRPILTFPARILFRLNHSPLK